MRWNRNYLASGSESYVVGSHEFYLGYAVTQQKTALPGRGPFHPTETIADKISSLLCSLDEILLHVSRGVRWDSDHVVILSDELEAIAQELVRGDFLGRVHIGLDYFDGSINRVAAWTIGARCMIKALLLALLEPMAALRKLEAEGDYHLAPGAAGGGQDSARTGRCGIIIARARVCRPARPGWRKSSGTKRKCCQSESNQARQS